MRIPIIAIVVLAAGACASTGPSTNAGEYLTPAPVVAVLAPEAAARVSRPSCREDTLRYQPGWAVPVATMEDVDRALAALLPEEFASLGLKRRPLDGFHRQFVGVQAGGRRLVYIGGVARVLDSSWGRTASSRGAASAEQVRAALSSGLIEIDDVGSGRWAILFDPGNRRFGALAVDCSFGGAVAADAGDRWLPDTTVARTRAEAPGRPCGRIAAMRRTELAAALRRGGFSGSTDRAAVFRPQGCMASDQGELGVYYYRREFGTHRVTLRLMFFSASKGYLGMYDVPGPPLRVERDRVVYDLPVIEGTEIRIQDGHLPRTVLLDGEVKELFR
jgi:hypothetical protein